MREMLMSVDREEISRGLAEGLPYKEIACRVGRDPPVISREVARHGGRNEYRAVAALSQAGAHCAGIIGLPTSLNILIAAHPA